MNEMKLNTRGTGLWILHVNVNFVNGRMLGSSEGSLGDICFSSLKQSSRTPVTTVPLVVNENSKGYHGQKYTTIFEILKY